MQGNETSSPRTKIGLFVTKGVWGGAQKYVYNLAVNLPKNKYDVFVVTGSGDALKERLEVVGIKTYVIQNLKRNISLFGEIKSFFTILNIIRKEKPTTIHLNSPKASGLGSLAGRILFVPKIVQTIHGFTWNEDRGAISKVSIVFFTWLTMIFCHKTIILSEREKRQAESLPFIKDKLVLIHNGVEKIDFKEKNIARKELFTKIGKDDNSHTHIFGTIAELHKNKGLEYAIQALAKIKTPFLFFILGGGEQKENLEKLIAQHKLENNIFLLGFIEKANEYLKAFDIFLLTSIKEGLPYAILEAGRASLPVIASNVGGIGTILESNRSGILITPRKTGDIVRALEYLIENPDKQKLFGENLHEKIESDFSIEQMLEKTEALYK